MSRTTTSPGASGGSRAIPRHRTLTGPVAWAISPLVAAAIAACASTGTVTVTDQPVAPGTSPSLPHATATNTGTPTPPPTPTPAPKPTPTPDEASTGGLIFPDAQVIITTCVNHPAEPTENVIGAIGTVVTLTGTITNTGSTDNDYIIDDISITGGAFNLGTANAVQVNNLAVGHTEPWSTTGLVTNNPTQPLTCSVVDVMSEPA